jgi:hypothetical protein
MQVYVRQPWTIKGVEVIKEIPLKRAGIMDRFARAQRLLELFQRLRNVLVAEQEKNWSRGIDLIVDALMPPFSDDEEVDAAIRYAHQTFRSMLAGAGSFSDFFIWREDFDERVEANASFDRLKEDIFSTFDQRPDR